MNPRTGLVVAGFVALAAVAVAGWTRHPQPVSPAPANTVATTQPAGQPDQGQPSYYQSDPQNAGSGNLSSAPVVSAPGNAGNYENAPAQTTAAYATAQPLVQTANAYPQPAYAGSTPCTGNGPGYQTANYSDNYMVASARPVVVRRPVVTRYVDEGSTERVVVVERHHRGRSKKRSLAIVAGTAGTGAVIGALAGGGRGAALGAASGGAAGFLYDRLTHNR